MLNFWNLICKNSNENFSKYLLIKNINNQKLEKGDLKIFILQEDKHNFSIIRLQNLNLSVDIF